MKITLDPEIASEAKALVALAFRNGCIENLHSGSPCLTCSGRPEISHITQEEMKGLMKSAVDALYRLLWLREYDPHSYQERLALGRRYTLHWDEPELKKPADRGSPPK
ncbi:hypothetical protein DYQ86_05070 [Acidobacteria bacterium AB60]|nr:hypothetical protein DYQ86_05070 [Acidobacteria bacterium AB60]